MYCPKCGEKNEEGVKFCSKCGTSMNEAKKEEVKQTNKKGNEGLGVASLVIGIISILFALIFNIWTIFIPIIGLILGIVNKVTGHKKVSGIVLNIIAIVLSIIMFFVWTFIIGLAIGETAKEASKDGSDVNKALNQIYNEIDRGTSDNYVAGKYNCKSFDGTGEKGDYIVRFELNDNNTFMWGKYNDTARNYVRGTYTFEDLKKKNASGEYAYYNIKLTGSEYYNEGVKQTEVYASEYEFGITAVGTKKQGILMNTKTYNMYYCYEEK